MTNVSIYMGDPNFLKYLAYCAHSRDKHYPGMSLPVFFNDVIGDGDDETLHTNRLVDEDILGRAILGFDHNDIDDPFHVFHIVSREGEFIRTHIQRFMKSFDIKSSNEAYDMLQIESINGFMFVRESVWIAAHQ